MPKRSIKNYEHRIQRGSKKKQDNFHKMFDSDSGRTVLLAVDHGYFQGATQGVRNLRKTIRNLIPYCDAISPTIGGFYEIDPNEKTPIIIRATGGNSMTKPDNLDDEVITVSGRTLSKTNAIGYSASCFIGMPNQTQSIKNLTDLINDEYTDDLISIGITAVGKGLGKDRIYLEHASRVLSENGADIVKTYYCKNFSRVVRSCLSPIVIAGGKQLDTPLDALKLTYNAIQDGAVGVDMGRNIFQDENPIAMIQAVRSIVHDGFSVEQAHKLYRREL